MRVVGVPLFELSAVDADRAALPHDVLHQARGAGFAGPGLAEDIGDQGIGVRHDVGQLAAGAVALPDSPEFRGGQPVVVDTRWPVRRLRDPSDRLRPGGGARDIAVDRQPTILIGQVAVHRPVSVGQRSNEDRRLPRRPRPLVFAVHGLHSGR